MPILELRDALKKPHRLGRDMEKAEHFVKVKWIRTVPIEKAIKEKGFFGNQNTVAEPRVQKWRSTVERLKSRFGIND